ncbi:MAG TPA: hypothetical protein VL361_16095 [Candidatus Limnocylindrales bacterium]|nr:hypothetical protein [Candidatus Limnocylindrales bacterium]
MKARSMFLVSLILMVGALLMVLKGRGSLTKLFRLGTVTTVSFFGSLPIEVAGLFTLRGDSLLEAWHACSPHTADASERGDGQWWSCFRCSFFSGSRLYETQVQQTRCSEPGDGVLVCNRRSVAPGH